MLYERVLRPLLYALPAEDAHHAAFGALRVTAALRSGKKLLRATLAPEPDPALEVEALGLRFPTPVGLAAGFDKDAVGFEALAAAGFGFVEVGTLTAKAQSGNAPPRLFRLPCDRALINRMGFNNRGSAEAAPRLAQPRTSIVGVNIGKSKVTPDAEAIDDYVTSTRRLASHADYLVVNVSSPNTPGLRDLQAIERLEPLLVAVRQAADRTAQRHVPLLVKIAPDLADDDVDAVAGLARALALDGIVATNTTIRRELETPRHQVDAIGAGGLSGAPLRARSFEVLQRLRRRLGDAATLISVGGIEDADEAWRRIRHGASLVQIYTAYIYQGPMLPRRLAEGLAARARAAGFSRVMDAIGTAEA